MVKSRKTLSLPIKRNKLDETVDTQEKMWTRKVIINGYKYMEPPEAEDART